MSVPLKTVRLGDKISGENGGVTMLLVIYLQQLERKIADLEARIKVLEP